MFTGHIKVVACFVMNGSTKEVFLLHHAVESMLYISGYKSCKSFLVLIFVVADDVKSCGIPYQPRGNVIDFPSNFNF